ncbi:MAG: tetratricopeptide repeat protein [Bryobacterales bacterium]|nr:tetratricopeptide repeat protein [Bryobacterales bacterium]
MEATVSADEVREQLLRVLSSGGFRSSQRLCRFLRFLVERTLENDGERLKEYVLAIEVFDRNETYDPSIDSIVRVEARRLRHKLKAYYEGPGRHDPVFLELRPGNYVPVFRPLAAAAAGLAPVEAAYTSIAVLPFVNMSPEPDQEYFCDGITEEIINALASLDEVAVVSRTSSFQFKGQAVDVREVGAKLGAELIVEGSVRKAGTQLRITAQAIDANNGYHVWSETYRRELPDVFAIQEEISTSIAGRIRAKLPGRALRRGGYQPPLEAYTAYCKALHLLHQEDMACLQAALAEFRGLTSRYPDYADPYAGVATVYAALSNFGVVCGREILPELRHSAETAVRLNPDSSAAWTVMAGISAHWEFDWAEAESRFRRAIALQPSNYAAHSWYGGVLAMLGRFDEAEREYGVAIRLNPLFASGHARMGFLRYLRGDACEALRHLNEALRLAEDFPEGRFALGMVYLHQGDYAEAIEILSRRLEEMPIAIHMGMLVGAYHRSGEEAKCQKMLRRLEQMAAKQYVTPMARVAACVGMGDSDGAITALAASIEDRAIFANVLNVDPFVDPLRSDPRFERLVRSMGLTPRSAVTGSASHR